MIYANAVPIPLTVSRRCGLKVRRTPLLVINVLLMLNENVFACAVGKKELTGTASDVPFSIPPCVTVPPTVDGPVYAETSFALIFWQPFATSADCATVAVESKKTKDMAVVSVETYPYAV